MNTCVSLRLAKKQSIAEGIVLLELTAPDGRELPPFTAGAHLLLNLPGGLSRAYSLCNDPAERHRYQLAINLDPRSRLSFALRRSSRLATIRSTILMI